MSSCEPLTAIRRNQDSWFIRHRPESVCGFRAAALSKRWIFSNHRHLSRFGVEFQRHEAWPAFNSRVIAFIFTLAINDVWIASFCVCELWRKTVENVHLKWKVCCRLVINVIKTFWRHHLFVGIVSAERTVWLVWLWFTRRDYKMAVETNATVAMIERAKNHFSTSKIHRTIFTVVSSIRILFFSSKLWLRVLVSSATSRTHFRILLASM